jgi:hypothetical protein
LSTVNRCNSNTSGIMDSSKSGSSCSLSIEKLGLKLVFLPVQI